MKDEKERGAGRDLLVRRERKRDERAAMNGGREKIF
jgi:hypothetical protein